MFRVIAHCFKFFSFFMLLVLQRQTHNRQEILFSLQSTKARPANTNVTDPTESPNKHDFFQWLCIFPTSLPTVFDALSCLDTRDSPNNSVGYQYHFCVEFNPMVKDMLFSNSGLHIPALFCVGQCKCTWRILPGTGNRPRGCKHMHSQWEANSGCARGLVRWVTTVSCTVTINLFYLALSMALKVLVRSPPFWYVPSIALTTSSFVLYVFKLNTTRGSLAYWIKPTYAMKKITLDYHALQSVTYNHDTYLCIRLE